MDAGFWHQRWENNEIGFHEDDGNSLLLRHFNQLGLIPGSRVFVPLCGKTRDIAWLLSSGYKVAGAELNESAIVQLFADLNLEAKVATVGTLKRYSSEDIDIFVGDIFDLTATALGRVDAVYDRAALVALPDGMRKRYATLLRSVTPGASRLTIIFEYDQSSMDGPPFSISDDEMQLHFDDDFQISLLESKVVQGGLKGKCPAREKAWLLRKHVSD